MAQQDYILDVRGVKASHGKRFRIKLRFFYNLNYLAVLKKDCTSLTIVLSDGNFQTAAFGQRMQGEVDLALLPVQYGHYMPEYALDTPVDPKAWDGLGGGLHVLFASTERAWFRTEVPQLKMTFRRP
jgi:hypothetical protein